MAFAHCGTLFLFNEVQAEGKQCDDSHRTCLLIWVNQECWYYINHLFFHPHSKQMVTLACSEHWEFSASSQTAAKPHLSLHWQLDWVIVLFEVPWWEIWSYTVICIGLQDYFFSCCSSKEIFSLHILISYFNVFAMGRLSKGMFTAQTVHVPPPNIAPMWTVGLRERSNEAKWAMQSLLSAKCSEAGNSCWFYYPIGSVQILAFSTVPHHPFDSHLNVSSTWRGMVRSCWKAHSQDFQGLLGRLWFIVVHLLPGGDTNYIIVSLGGLFMERKYYRKEKNTEKTTTKNNPWCYIFNNKRSTKIWSQIRV